MRRARLLIKAGWMLLALVLSATSSWGGQSGGRVFLIGIDGASWNVIDPLLRQGRLPNLARLTGEGSRAALASIKPTVSPALWTSVATGKSFAKHGIDHFVRRARPDGNNEFAIMHVTSNLRRTKALWNIASDCDRRVAFVGWWVTWPAEKVNGYMVSSYVPLDQNRSAARPAKGTLLSGVAGQTWPPELFELLQPLIRPADSVGPDELGRFAQLDGRTFGHAKTTGLAWAYAADETYRMIVQQLLELDPDIDLWGVYFNGVDVVSHRFWSAFEPRGIPPPLTPLWRDVIPNYYAYIDESLGRLMAYRRAGDTFLIVSDHGFERGNHHAGPPGILIAAGAAIQARAEPQSPRLVDIAPTVLALLGLPAAEDMDGRVLEELFTPAWRAAYPRAAIATYDTEAWAEQQPIASEVDAELRERLRALGYIE